jgi:hypothetical protein
MNNTMKDKKILIKKTQFIGNKNYEILGKKRNREEMEEYDENIFNDKEFYQVLLKDLIEGVNENNYLNDESFNPLKKTKLQKNKGFSRGKKIRCIFHLLISRCCSSKISWVFFIFIKSFMSPVGEEINSSFDPLFNNLFGGVDKVFKEKIDLLIEEKKKDDLEIQKKILDDEKLNSDNNSIDINNIDKNLYKDNNNENDNENDIENNFQNDKENDNENDNDNDNDNDIENNFQNDNENDNDDNNENDNNNNNNDYMFLA